MSGSRQLAAIMFTDIVGYTALMGEDEEKAFEVLKRNRQIHKTLIKRFNGRWLKEIGDGVLVSFSTVTDAVYCAGAIQKACEDEPNLKLRISIHQGEVVFDGEDVFGDGVNIASRMEPLAPIGGILVSESVYKNITNKKKIETRFHGEETLKNVKEPVKTYEVLVEGIEDLESTVPFEEPELNLRKSSGTKRPVFITLGIILLIVITYLIYNVSPRNQESDIISEITLSDKSIAVLPFENLSNDPDQIYFSDGMMEEILNHLYKIGDLLVSSRTSSMRYRGSTKSIPEIARELGVSTILEGSVRKSGNRVRITVQLIDGKTDKHLWAESYDRTLDDVFAIQSEVAQTIASTLQAEIHPEVRMRIQSQPTDNTEAYNLFLETNQLRTYDEEENRRAIEMLKEVIQMDPTFGRAYSMTGIRLQTGATFFRSGAGMDPETVWANSKPYFEKAIELDPNDGAAYVRMAWSTLWFEWDFAKAGYYYAEAKKIFPNYSWTDYLVVSGEFEEAAAGAEKSMEIDPSNGLSWSSIIAAQYFVGDHQNAIQNIETALNDSMQLGNVLTLSESSRVYMYLGMFEEAVGVIKIINEFHPSLESPRILAIEAISQYHLDNYERTMAIIERLKEKSAENAGGSPSFYLAMIYSDQGEVDQAFEWLEKSYETHEVELHWLKVEPPFNPLHDDPRWQQMLDKIGFPE